jgi:hypothetical protein
MNKFELYMHFLDKLGMNFKFMHIFFINIKFMPNICQVWMTNILKVYITIYSQFVPVKIESY